MKIRLIASDIDNTLIPQGCGMSEKTRNILLECEKMGIPVALSSGRTLYSARRVSQEIGLKGPIISANGGRVDLTPEGNVIFEDCIPKPLSTKIYEHLWNAGCYMTSFVGTHIYLMDERNGYGSLCCKRVATSATHSYVIANDEARFYAEGTLNPYKYEAYSDDVRLLERLKSDFLSWGLSVSSAFPCNLEIMTAGGGKGRALKAMAERLGIPREEIIAFGDGTNDQTMIEYAGIGVAMGNAVESLKKSADMIAPDCKEDGVWQILNEYVLERK